MEKREFKINKVSLSYAITDYFGGEINKEDEEDMINLSTYIKNNTHEIIEHFTGLDLTCLSDDFVRFLSDEIRDCTDIVRNLYME